MKIDDLFAWCALVFCGLWFAVVSVFALMIAAAPFAAFFWLVWIIGKWLEVL